MSSERFLIVENSRLRLQYDGISQSISITKKEGEYTFIRDVQFDEDIDTIGVTELSDDIWGDGQALEVRHPSGAIDRITMYADISFVFFKRTLVNNSGQPVELQSLRPVSLVLDLGAEAANLRALGTAGLTGISGEDNPGSYAFLAVAHPATRHGVVAGWLTHDRGSGVLFSDIADDEPVLNAQIDYGKLLIRPEQSANLESLIIGWFDDIRLGLEAYADAIAKQYSIKLPAQPAVYCSWYHAGASDEERLARNAAFAKEHLTPFGLAVVQIDDGWQAGESKNGPRKNFTTHRPDGPYKSGMKHTADKLKAMGLAPGIWFMPFAGTWDAPHFKDKQHWFAQKDGKPYDTAWGGTCLDMTHPEAREYVRSVVRRISHDWGYRYFKMDGLWTGTASRQMYVNMGYQDDKLGEATLHNPEVTHIEAYRNGLRMIREAAGDDVFFLGCCIPQNMRTLGASFGLVDAMRIGPDNGTSWDGIRRGAFSGSCLYFLHGRVWQNDPDPVYVRESVPLEQARTLVSWVAISGQLNASSIDYYDLPEERLDILKRSIPSHGLTPRPVDVLEQRIPRIWLLTDESKATRRDIIALFNWEDEQALHIEYPMDKLGLSEDETYIGFDYWADEFIPPFGKWRDGESLLRAELPHGSCKILAVLPIRNNPQLLSTSRHITQGIVDVHEQYWDDETRTLSGVSDVIGHDRYELRITAISLEKDWQVKSADVSEEDKSEEVTISIKQDGSEVRALIQSKSSRQVKWQVTFD